MNNIRIKIIFGVKNIWNNKWKLVYPIVYLLVISAIWSVAEEYVPTYNYLSLPNLNTWILRIFMVEIEIIGLGCILMLLGTPEKNRKTEKRLESVGFVDSTGNPPTLISKKIDKMGIAWEFYSSKIPMYKYEEHKSEIGMALNVDISSIIQGKDKRRVIVISRTTSEMINWNDSYLEPKDFILKLGESHMGEESFNLAITPHALIGGGSGSGKSKLLKLILVQCLEKGASIYLADFKGGVDYPKFWHEKCRIIIDSEKFLDQLADILKTMEERQALLIESGTSNISDYNSKTNNNLSRIVIACDEVAEVLDKTGLDKEEKAVVSQIEGMLSTIARLGRAFGIHLVLSTQRPDADILKGQIKNNIGMRICGRADKVLSQIILDNPDGAHKISQEDQGVFLTNSNVLFKAYYLQEDCI